jgi:hypothetical protein
MTLPTSNCDMPHSIRRPQISILGSAEPGSAAYERAGEAGMLLANLGITVVSGCGSPATRVAAERAVCRISPISKAAPLCPVPYVPRMQDLETAHHLHRE